MVSLSLVALYLMYADSGRDGTAILLLISNFEYVIVYDRQG